MEIAVKTGEIEEMSGEVRRLGARLDEVISTYNTITYEILNEMETELEEEIKISMEEVKKHLEEGFLTVKKHESFLIDAYTLYEDTERRVTAEASEMRGDLYAGGESSGFMHSVSGLTVLPFVNPTIFSLVVPKLPDSKVSRLNLKADKDGIIIKRLRDSIVSGKDKRYDVESGFRALVDFLLPGALSAGLITDLFSALADLTEGSEEDGVGGSGSFSSLYEKFVWLVGQAFQTNYYMVEPEFFEFILEGIVDGALFWAGLSKYDRLSEAEHLKGAGLAGNITPKESEDAEDVKEKSDDVLKNMAAAVGGAYGYVNGEEKNEEEEKEEKYTDQSLNIKGSFYEDDEEGTKENESSGFYYGDIAGAAYDENEEKDRRYEGSLYGGAYSTYSDTDKYGTYGKDKDEFIDMVLSMGHKEPTDEEISPGAEWSFGSSPDSATGGSDGSFGGGLYSGDFSYSEDDELQGVGAESAYMGAKADTPVSRGSEKTEYNKSNIFYDRILYSTLGEGQSANRRRSGYMAAAGSVAALGGLGGAGGTGIIGSLGSLAADSIGEGISAYIPSFLGVLNIGNILDLVGKAQLCSLDWLGELSNILA